MGCVAKIGGGSSSTSRSMGWVRGAKSFVCPAPELQFGAVRSGPPAAAPPPLPSAFGGQETPSYSSIQKSTSNGSMQQTNRPPVPTEAEDFDDDWSEDDSTGHPGSVDSAVASDAKKLSGSAIQRMSQSQSHSTHLNVGRGLSDGHCGGMMRRPTRRTSMGRCGFVAGACEIDANLSGDSAQSLLSSLSLFLARILSCALIASVVFSPISAHDTQVERRKELQRRQSATKLLATAAQQQELVAAQLQLVEALQTNELGQAPLADLVEENGGGGGGGGGRSGGRRRSSAGQLATSSSKERARSQSLHALVLMHDSVDAGRVLRRLRRRASMAARVLSANERHDGAGLARRQSYRQRRASGDCLDDILSPASAARTSRGRPTDGIACPFCRSFDDRVAFIIEFNGWEAASAANRPKRESSAEDFAADGSAPASVGLLGRSHSRATSGSRTDVSTDHEDEVPPVPRKVGLSE
uniref:Uncharacterized protein n=1 Tax=Plectus sambesii TaxID=2011161 RepID=A0A914W112_9BILA